MTTVSINLVPVPRQIDRMRRSRIKTWLVIGSAFSVVLVVAFAVFKVMIGTAFQSVDSELNEVNAQLALAGKNIQAIQPQLVNSRLTLQASRAVGNQPDWSVLVALLTSRLNDRVVLSYMGLSPVAVSTAQPTVPRVGRRGAPAKPAKDEEVKAPQQFSMDVRGMAKTQAALSTFVLKLEQAKIFAKVVLQDAQRVGFVKGEAIQFQIHCTLVGRQVSP